jgi:hypothetical protein
MLYARAITLRNCGRFTVIASDFGSDYRTHTHVTSEALYASLTRGATWRPRTIDLKDDPADFTLAYDVAAMPTWFLPGTFVADGVPRLPDAHLDRSAFNVVNELYPSTSKIYVFKKGSLTEKDRPYHVPTYGTIQTVKTDRRLTTWAFSPKRALLEDFSEGQTFVLGKKRTMFQIVTLSEIAGSKIVRGRFTSPFIQVTLEDVCKFASYEILAATMRYLILRGEPRDEEICHRFDIVSGTLYVPEWYLRRSLLLE